MKKKRLMITLLSVISILMFVGFAYAYLAAGVNNNNAQTASITTGTMNLTFADGTTVLNATQMTIGESVTKTFTIENTGTLDATASMYFKDLVNTYMADSMSYRLEESTSENGTYEVLKHESTVPQSTSQSEHLISGRIIVPAGTKLYYRLIITFNNLPNIDQSADVNARLNTKFTLKAGANITESEQTMIALNLIDEVKTSPTSYNMFNYTWAGYNPDGKVSGIGETQGIYAMEDDFGMSYYFRGPKTLNNIVKFGKYDTDMYIYYTDESNRTGSLAQCQAEVEFSDECSYEYKYASQGDDMYWRIVRINGDGTLRLMYIGTSPNATGINASIGYSEFNLIDESDKKYAGYTYDNSAPDAGDGTASSVKQYLDMWYSRSMSNEDSNIALAQFYSDTTGYHLEYKGGRYGYYEDVYSSSDRLDKYYMGLTEEVSPTLKTETTNQTYGGRYNLKVGLINVDELVLSGFDGIGGAQDYDETGVLYPYTVPTVELDEDGNLPFFHSFSPAGGRYFKDDFESYSFQFDTTLFGDSIWNAPNINPVINLTKEYARSLAWDSANGYYVAP